MNLTSTNFASLAEVQIDGYNPFAKAYQLFQSPMATQIFNELKEALRQRLSNFEGTLNGVDRLSENGNYVTSGIEERIRNPESASNFSIDFLGHVILEDSFGKTLLGDLSIPYNSDWGRQRWVNTNNLSNVPSITFVPYRCMEFIDPEKVDGSTSGALVFSERQRLAAELAMCAHGLIGYMNCAYIIKNEAFARPIAVRENINDALAICDYLEVLRAELESLHPSPALDLTKLSLSQTKLS